MKRMVVAAAVVAAALTHSASAQTNGFVLQCLSARTSGQGCVTRANSNIPTTLFRDPAGIVSFKESAFEINFAPFMPSLTFENTAQTGIEKGASHAYPMASFAYIAKPIGKVSWGLGMEPIGGFGSDFKLRHALLSQATGKPLDYESFFAAAKFGPTLAYALTPELSIGGSFSAMYAQIRYFRMPFTMSPAIAKGLAGIPQLDPGVYGPLFQQFTELTAYGDSRHYQGFTWAADAGISYHGSSGLAFSASWSPKRPITVDGGTATIDMTAQFTQLMMAMIQARMQAYNETTAAAQQQVMQQLGTAGVNLQAGMVGNYDAATTLTIPMTVGGGISIPAGKNVRLVGEVEWRQWSKAEASMPFDLTKGSNANINLMVNANPSDGAFFYPFPLYWQDAFSGKVGFELALQGSNFLRGGFLTSKNPVPDSTVFVTFPAISTKAVTVGTTLKLVGVPLDLSFVHAFPNEQQGSAPHHDLGNEYVSSLTKMSENVFTIGVVLKR